RAEPRERRLGLLMSQRESDSTTSPLLTALRDRLYKLGWEEGRNLEYEYRWGGADFQHYPAYAAELVASAPDVIFVGNTPALAAAQRATSTIPIVFTQISDPVSAGFVPSLARPGGNITGFTNFEYTIGGKWLQLIKEAAPGIVRVG